ncbi:MAG: 4-(cytidine 5'-diphospho)-2-C-methyl-D-erythritol kinase [Bacteroidota bacterium]|jgi:4-diphosphocytidyl-2-C-methyl-D-erythritol kinase|nr:4-(cytidine 5'-diphospho)-2-C-methyl-D-erythritol kinase [Prolixibacteraceae bacterium]MDI9564385.1 4-(cytidine 5'-diphospho)-2-C-methyl-D-erythritol kinase [Bacteroidota bacterium]NLT00401.1 4-(cytidine 5'-diphospho)-2-C-methyl-D-erythritol kinase [Bacteroidales bacterium]HNZ70117.1 4-(cytidine 5'-diphospho)-2-C-methyl-D-erythritol kinase [Prolixibacteraceae bacterium]HOC87380.1 4-(cytidine 5'-diphospho)-2-C-methyl-D-erythritol kinase [Prolixibacteraceae bacterium]
MISFPNAKINLGLHVVERRSDGYHNLESLFYPVELCDILEVIPGERFGFQSTGLTIEGPEEENLVVRAWRLLQKRFDLPPVRIHLHKVIPIGAGLGGGSSDGAFMLKMANDLFMLGMTEAKLEEMAAALGADCPFFIGNRAALATGTGNILQPVDLDLSGYKIVIVKPPLAVSTGMAYKVVTPRRPDHTVAEVVTRPVEEWKELLVNDFEEHVFAMFPEIGTIREELFRLGAVYASMSGSGSSVYGLFREIPSCLADKFPGDYFVFPRL